MSTKSPSVDTGNGVPRVNEELQSEAVLPGVHEDETHTFESVNDTFSAKEYIKVTKNGIEYLQDKKGALPWCEKAHIKGQRLLPGMSMMTAPEAVWLDLSKPEDLAKYNNILGKLVPEESPAVEITANNGQFYNGSYPALLIYQRVWYRAADPD